MLSRMREYVSGLFYGDRTADRTPEKVSVKISIDDRTNEANLDRLRYVWGDDLLYKDRTPEKKRVEVNIDDATNEANFDRLRHVWGDDFVRDLKEGKYGLEKEI